jgi:hypothetical protein
MSLAKCPMPVAVIACLYVVAGVVGLVLHLPHTGVFHQGDVWTALTALAALAAGAFMLKGRNWARWLAIAWMAFHVVVTWPSVAAMVIHSLFLAAIAWLLFLPESRQFFAEGQSASQM